MVFRLIVLKANNIHCMLIDAVFVMKMLLILSVTSVFYCFLS